MEGDEMSAKQHTVMVTGAAGNLGKAVASKFSSAGARLVLIDRSAEILGKAFGDESPDRQFLPTDLLDERAVQTSFDAAVARCGRIDALCNLAGGFRMGAAVHETAPDVWDFLWNLNVRTLLNMVRVAVPHMVDRGGGKIVNVGAYSAQKGLAQMGAYCASKSAVIRITESMAAELREKNINVNCVLPTVIDTPENRAAMPGADPARWVAPTDLASVIAFLASQSSNAVHGASVPVTGLS
jgi:NAD(P)-dependent dehydrogenase (short-subunit alcohol dehydrogenase family)